MKDRIQRILQEKQLTSAKLADLIEVQRSSISHILSGRNKPSMDFMEKILTCFPEISGDWLITGKGHMYKDQRAVQPAVNPTNQAEKKGYSNNLFETSIPTTSLGSNITVPKHEPGQQVHSQPNIPPKPPKVVKRVVIYYDDNSYDELFLNK